MYYRIIENYSDYNAQSAFYEDYLIQYVDKPYRQEFKKQMSIWSRSSKLYGKEYPIGILKMVYNLSIEIARGE